MLQGEQCSATRKAWTGGLSTSRAGLHLVLPSPDPWHGAGTVPGLQFLLCESCLRKLKEIGTARRGSLGSAVVTLGKLFYNPGPPFLQSEILSVQSRGQLPRFESCLSTYLTLCP